MAVTRFDPPTQWKTYATRKPAVALSFYTEPELWAIEVYFERIGTLDVFGSCDLDLDPMTLIDELDQYCTARMSYKGMCS